MSVNDGRYAALLARIDNTVVLGPELLRNPVWIATATTHWSIGSGWGTPSAGTITATSATGGMVQTSSLFAVGKTYRVSYQVVTLTAGNVRFQFTGGSHHTGVSRSAVGVYEEDVKISETIASFRIINGGTAFSGTLCNLSVREVLSI